VVVCAAFLVYWFRPQAPPQSGTSRPLTQLTFEDGLQTDPTLSPDGSLFAYASDRSGNFDIWVQPVGGNPHQITSDPAHDWQPQWSPRENLIAFRSERNGGGIYVVATLGGSERRIADFGYRPRWSTDGSVILFSGDDYTRGIRTPKLFVTDSNGSPPRPILEKTLSRFTSVHSVEWLPGQQLIHFFGLHAEQGYSAWITDLEGKQLIKSDADPDLVRLAKEAGIVGVGDDARFSALGFGGPDLVFASERFWFMTATVRGVRNIWRITRDPKAQKTVALDRMTTGPGPEGGITVSGDGRKLAFTARTERTKIWLVPLDGKTGQAVGEAEPVTPPGVDSDMGALSRNAQKLVYRSSRAGRWEVREKDLVGGSETLLLSDASRRGYFVYSPDGSSLLYARRDPPPSNAEAGYLLLRGSSAEQRLTVPRPLPLGWIPADVTPDGKTVLLSCNPDEQNREWGFCDVPLTAAPDLDKHSRVLLIEPGFDFYCADYSPDGRWIVFEAVPNGGVAFLGVMPASGGRWLQLTKGDFWDDKTQWSSDGRFIYFLSNRSNLYNVWALKFDGVAGKAVGEPFQVTKFDTPRLCVPDLRNISVNGNKLAIPVTEISGNIWLLEGVDR
jgi:eukaryotic-like serine/threonine-protein kinase